MTAHLLIAYPHPKNSGDFDRRYRDEHLPYDLACGEISLHPQ